MGYWDCESGDQGFWFRLPAWSILILQTLNKFRILTWGISQKASSPESAS